MKARVKETGEIVEIVQFLDNDKIPTTYDEDELEFFPNYDYWEKLKHQYAGMAMQGLLTHHGVAVSPDWINEEAEAYALALVEKMKEE